MNTEERIKIKASFSLSPSGRFEVIAITTGVGNGWTFTPLCLQDSLPLWEGIECFVDHGENGCTPLPADGRSVRDLAGIFHNPRWDEAAAGILLDLEPLGPSGSLLEAVGTEMLAHPGGDAPRLGFSADLIFTAQGKTVQKIIKVLTLDLVFNPARGGAFLRSIHPIHPSSPPLSKSIEITGGLNMSQETQPTLDPTQAVRVQMCEYLLESGLNSARLPATAAEYVRRQFEGKEFTPLELNTAIDQARKLVSDLTGSAVVSGPGRVNSMFSAEDQLQAAVDDLFGAPRQPAHAALKAARLSGIRELYLLLTGDRNLYGGYYSENVQLATTLSFAGLVKNAMNKVVADQWEQLGAAGYNWWQRVVSLEHFETLNEITGVLVGTVGALPSVAEGAEYTELKIGDSAETASFTKYGGYIPLTLELIDRDDTRKLRLYPRELAKAGLRKISSLVAAVFSSASGVGPTLADGGALFNSTAVTTAGGHHNLRTGALSAAEWEAVRQSMYRQPMFISNEAGSLGTGDACAVHPRYLLAPVELELTARKILYGGWENSANIHADNLQRQMDGDLVLVPEWTDSNDWAAVADPRIMPGIIVGERFGPMPEIFIAGDETSPAVFMNDEHRIKVRHYAAVLVQDFRALHKNNVAP